MLVEISEKSNLPKSANEKFISACERFGRKCVMLIGLALFAIGWMLLCMDISSMETAIVGRLKTGVACGVMSIACPTYIGEVTTADVRGFFGAGFQFMGEWEMMRMKKVVFF